jgi:flagellar protein FlgJ
MVVLKLHDRGDEVRKLQTLLNSTLKPSPNLTADGIFGLRTDQAVKQFQIIKGLKPDGIVGSNTWAALGQKVSTPDLNIAKIKYPSQSAFIESLLPAAKHIETRYRIPKAVMIAQACLETEYGKRVTMDDKTKKSSLNLFNIKGKGPAGSAKALTKEFINGKWITVEADFRAYNSYEESFEDYAKLITGSSVYKEAMNHTNDPKEFARQIKNAGYATDPTYDKKLSWIMDTFSL